MGKNKNIKEIKVNKNNLKLNKNNILKIKGKGRLKREVLCFNKYI